MSNITRSYYLDEARIAEPSWKAAWRDANKAKSLEPLKTLYFGDLKPETIERIILYHGTCSLLADTIWKEGLKPRDETRISNWNGALESQPSFVYLATRKVSFELADARHRPHYNYRHCGLETVRVDVDTKNLVPDEDAQKITGFSPGFISNLSLEFAPCDTWYESLYRLNTCAHKGRIPPERILGIEELYG